MKSNWGIFACTLLHYYTSLLSLTSSAEEILYVGSNLNQPKADHYFVFVSFLKLLCFPKSVGFCEKKYETISKLPVMMLLHKSLRVSCHIESSGLYLKVSEST